LRRHPHARGGGTGPAAAGRRHRRADRGCRRPGLHGQQPAHSSGDGTRTFPPRARARGAQRGNPRTAGIQQRRRQPIGKRGSDSRCPGTGDSEMTNIINPQKPVQRIAIVGTGTIGASWATHYLARGFDVTATDPAPGAEAALRSYVNSAWEGANTLGLAPGASPDRLKFTSDLKAALIDADFVQENAPERPELKVKLF